MSRSPANLPHQLDRSAVTVRAVVETPAGSRAKFTLDGDSGLYALGKILPAGLAMPLDFGFVPSTCGGDGDPLDIMILGEVVLPTGCLVTARLIGAIEVEQRRLGSGDPPQRNDRLVARLADSKAFATIDRLDQLGDGFVTELNLFFASYKAQRGQSYDVIAVSGPERAVELVEEAAAAA